MSGYRAGDERLGRVLRDTVEGRGRPGAASLDGTGIGPRAFVSAVERAPEERRPAGERPRFGAIVAAAAIGAVAAAGLALWPSITHQLPASRPAPVAAERDAAQVVVASDATSEPTPTSTLPVGQPPARPAQPNQAAAVATRPAATAQPTPAATPATPAAPAPAAAQPALATPTFANHEVVGCCQALGGRWHDVAQGGTPAFHGPSAWTANGAATAIWTLGAPAGGQRWDSVRVRIWIPNRHAAAVVRFTVTATTGGARTVSTFDVAEQGHGGWLTIPGTYSAGTATRRTGSITVRMSFLRPFAGASCSGAACADMAAGQAMFEWS
jgi:hypothetical protein